MFAFGLFNDRETIALQSIQFNLDNFPVYKKHGAYYGFEYNVCMKKLHDPLMMFIPETQNACDEFKKCNIVERKTLKTMYELYPEFESRHYARHFAVEMRNFNYKQI